MTKDNISHTSVSGTDSVTSRYTSLSCPIGW